MARSLKISFIIIGLVYVVFFIAMYYFVKTAMAAYEPPVDSRYYEKGLEYQKRLDEFERAKAQGWVMKVNVLEADAVPKGSFSLKITVERDPAKPLPAMPADDPGRVSALVTLSHRATLLGSRKYEFHRSDFETKGKDRFELNRDIENPLNGSVEIGVEVRPTKDSAIYRSRTLLVQ